MENSTSFRSVDMFTRKHVVSKLLDIRLSSQLEQGRKDFIVDQVFGVIEEDRDIRFLGKLEGKLVESGRVGFEEVFKDEG